MPPRNICRGRLSKNCGRGSVFRQRRSPVIRATNRSHAWSPSSWFTDKRPGRRCAVCIARGAYVATQRIPLNGLRQRRPARSPRLRTRKHDRRTRLNNKAGWTGQHERLPGNTPSLHRKSTFLNDLTLRHRNACQRADDNHARQASEYRTAPACKNRMQNPRQPTGNVPDPYVIPRKPTHRVSPARHIVRPATNLFLCVESCFS